MQDDYTKAMLKGFYPAFYDRSIPLRVFYSNYIQTHVEQDITELINIRNRRTFRVFLSL